MVRGFWTGFLNIQCSGMLNSYFHSCSHTASTLCLEKEGHTRTDVSTGLIRHYWEVKPFRLGGWVYVLGHLRNIDFGPEYPLENVKGKTKSLYQSGYRAT